MLVKNLIKTIQNCDPNASVYFIDKEGNRISINVVAVNDDSRYDKIVAMTNKFDEAENFAYTNMGKVL